MSRILITAVGIILVIVLILFSTTYIVRYDQVAIQSRFGPADESSIKRDPGLKFRLPVFADRVTQLDTRVRLIETPSETVKTADDQQLVVKAFLLWRIDESGAGPLNYSTAYPSEEAARERLVDELRSALLALGQYEYQDLLGDQDVLSQAEQAIRERIAASAQPTGIIPVSVGISRLNLPAETSRAVVQRMANSRKNLGDQRRTEAIAEAGRIRQDAEQKAEKILAFAQNRAATIEAQAEDKAAEYLTQMSENEDLAIFLTWVEALETALSGYATFVLPTTIAPFHLMDMGTPIRDGIPQPLRTSSPPASSPPATDQPTQQPETDEPSAQ